LRARRSDLSPRARHAGTIAHGRGRICRLGHIANATGIVEGARALGLRVVRADPLLLALGILAAGFFAYYYITDPGRPGQLEPLGWFNSSDQGAYLQLVRDFADFRFPAEDFDYGPGYPAIAVPFWWMGLHYDPFAPFNGMVFVFVAAATYVTARRLSGSRAIAAAAGYGLVFATPLIVYVDKPWNSTMSLLAAAVILLLATSPAPKAWHPWVMGLVVGAAFAARYADIVWLGALAIVAILVGPARQRLPGLLGATAAAAVIVALVAYAQDRLLGSPFTTPYASHVDHVLPGSDQDLVAYDLALVPENAYGMFISPFLRGMRFGGEPFLQGMFWALLAIPGAVVALRRGRPFRPIVATLVVAVLGAYLFYLSFRGSGTGAVQFGALHYFKMWWPALAILAAIALGGLARWRPGGLGGGKDREPDAVALGPVGEGLPGPGGGDDVRPPAPVGRGGEGDGGGRAAG
jgi:hypothetical protein